MDDETLDKTGIVIYPAYAIRKVNAGEEFSITINIENNKNFAIVVRSSVGEFIQDSESLTNIVNDIDKYSDWFSSVDQTVDANSTAAITVTGKIPANLGSSQGSFFPAVIFNFEGQESGEGSVSFEHAVPLYLEVKDVAQIDLEISKFSTDRIVIGDKSEISIIVENTGNTYIEPSAYIEFFELPILNGKKKRLNTYTLNEDSAILLPESEIKEEVVWESDYPGHIEATVYVSAGDEEYDSKTIDFWIIPMNWIYSAAITLVGITALIALYFVLKKVVSKVLRSRRTMTNNKLP